MIMWGKCLHAAEKIHHYHCRSYTYEEASFPKKSTSQLSPQESCKACSSQEVLENNGPDHKDITRARYSKRISKLVALNYSFLFLFRFTDIKSLNLH